MARYFPHVVVAKRSPNQSQRTTPIKLIVVHATAGHNYKGTADLKALAGWFANPKSKVSSHVATDNEGYSARFVKDEAKAWHCAEFNGVSLGIEQVIPGDGTEITRDLYRETARWLAYWSLKHGVPLKQGRVTQSGSVITHGVIFHSQLGSAGGGHADPGPGYSMTKLLRLARFYKAAQRARRVFGKPPAR